MSRPRKTVDAKRVIELASKGLIVNEIAAMENVSHDTLERRFAAELEKGRALCNASLRKKQYEMAMAGNPIMLIWLGKNRLEQADKQEIDVRKRVTVQMIVGIEQNELNGLTNGYHEPKLLEISPSNERNLPEKESHSETISD